MLIPDGKGGFWNFPDNTPGSYFYWIPGTDEFKDMPPKVGGTDEFKDMPPKVGGIVLAIYLLVILIVFGFIAWMMVYG